MMHNKKEQYEVPKYSVLYTQENGVIVMSLPWELPPTPLTSLNGFVFDEETQEYLPEDIL